MDDRQPTAPWSEPAVQMGTRSNPILRRAIAVDYTEVYRYGSYINFSTEVLQNVIQLKSTYIHIYILYVHIYYMHIST